MMNFVLDKVFVDYPLIEEYSTILGDLLNNSKDRECFLKLIEKDYEDFKLDYRFAEEIVRKNLKVNLPVQIYYNVE